MSKQTVLLVLTCINIVKCISDSVQAFKEVVVIDPLCVGTHPVLVSSYLEGWIHLLYRHGCGVTLHFLLSQKRFKLFLGFYLKIQHGHQKRTIKEACLCSRSVRKRK